MIARILGVDDYEIVRQGVCHILDIQAEWELAGEATNGEEGASSEP